MVNSTLQSPSISRFNQLAGWILKHWLLMLNVLMGIYVLAPFTAPVFMRLGWESPGRAIYLIYRHESKDTSVFRSFSYSSDPYYLATGKAAMAFESSNELGDTAGLGLLPGKVTRIRSQSSVVQGLKIPHMGWNQVRQVQAHPLWNDIEDGARYYFVHSYYVTPENPAWAAGTTEYGIPFTCAVARDNIFAVQFHPEKSARDGLALLKNFIHWQP